MLRYRWVRLVAKDARNMPSPERTPPAITTGRAPYWVLRALPTGPAGGGRETWGGPRYPAMQLTLGEEWAWGGALGFPQQGLFGERWLGEGGSRLLHFCP